MCTCVICTCINGYVCRYKRPCCVGWRCQQLMRMNDSGWLSIKQATGWGNTDRAAVKQCIILSSALECSAVRCNTVQYSTLQCASIQCNAVYCSALHCADFLCSVGGGGQGNAFELWQTMEIFCSSFPNKRLDRGISKGDTQLWGGEEWDQKDKIS